MKKPISLYLHIPFCVQKCLYCDFLSFPAGEEIKDRYLQALIREIMESAGRAKDRQVVSVFLGGGTPSILTAGQTEELLGAVRESYRIKSGAEITIEANPGTVTKEKLDCYRRAGINRISFGLQSARDEELRLLGRIHTYREFLESFRLAEKAGFDNINVDLICALPMQTLESWMETLKKTAALKPAHISAYSLIIEEGTPFYDRYHQEDVLRAAGERTGTLPGEETEREMYRQTVRFLEAEGYRHYEISNYGIPGRESIHNIGYWTRREYLGFGLGAASLLRECRWKNTEDLSRYLQRFSGEAPGEEACHDVREELDRLTGEDCMEEMMFLGLRMMEGVSKKRFLRETGVPVRQVYGQVIDLLKAQKLMEEDGEFLRLTPRGIDLSNYCMGQFLL